ncbi:MAG: S8 family peptidase [Candidatus Bipolaricaulis sp.]|nr:S8 family peptidase [Candidatus Bipolaricaulis sp.]
MTTPLRWLVTLAIVLLGTGFASSAADGVSRIAPSLRAFLAAGSDATARGLGDLCEVEVSPTGETRLRVLVRTTEPLASSSLGARVGFSGDEIATVAVSAAGLERLAEDERVIYIEPSRKMRPTVDASVPAVGADVVHTAIPSVLGEGVVIGLVDTGIDYEHLDFRFDEDGDGTEESSRILAIWDQTYGLFGAEYDRDDVESDLAFGHGPSEGIVREKDANGHGTHVASIAAGDGSSSGYGFVGVAPAASIVAVKTTFYTADILEGVEYILDKADALDAPVVVNLSLGGHEGPHDGTSLFERGLAGLADGTGRVIVVSAGNEGDEEIHVSGTLQSGSKAFRVKPDTWQFELSLWYPGDARFAVTVTSPSGATAVALPGASSGYVATPDGVAYVDNAADGVNPNNGDREVYLRLSGVAAGAIWTVAVRRLSGSGRFDAWVTSTGSIVNGDSVSTIDEPGNAEGVITVGAWTTKSTWPSKAGAQDYTSSHEVDGLSGFSSQGPTRDGRLKPDLVAPGAWICAALSTSAAAFDYLTHPDGVHGMQLGTSMAAPHVSGAAALLLSVDRTLTVGKILTALTSTATRDAYTGTTPNMRWGYGKLAVVAALENLEAEEPPLPPVDVPEIGLEENPVSGEARFTYVLPNGTGMAVLRVYTVSGILVFEADLDVDDDAYTWALVSRHGEPLAAGLYLYVVVTDRGASEVGKLVIHP